MVDRDIIVEKDFENKDLENRVLEWKLADEEPDTIEQIVNEEELADNSYLESEELNGAFPVKMVLKKDYDLPEVKDAIKREISKFKAFKAFKEVKDEGQKSIPTKWVVKEQLDSGKDEPYKARL